MARRTIRVTGTVRRTVRITHHVRLRPTIRYVQPIPLIAETSPTLAEMTALECSEHGQHATITATEHGTQVRACCDEFRARIEEMLAA
jgi:hypothetical protein